MRYTAQMHGSSILFALHILVGRAYKAVNRPVNNDRARIQKKYEETPMNPIRIAKKWLAYRRTMNELGGLSNQSLNDIGLTRYDIRNVAARSYR